MAKSSPYRLALCIYEVVFHKAVTWRALIGYTYHSLEDGSRQTKKA